jgi:DNA-binding transcriptional LysR family regulator
VNIIAEGCDLAIRMGQIEDRELIGRWLTDVSMVLVASPSYLAAHGVPERALELQNHIAVLTQKKFDHWMVGGETVRVRWGLARAAWSLPTTRYGTDWGLPGCRSSSWREIWPMGRSARVLPEFDVPGFAATALYPRSVVPSLALRTLLNALSDWCA